MWLKTYTSKLSFRIKENKIRFKNRKDINISTTHYMLYLQIVVHFLIFERNIY